MGAAAAAAAAAAGKVAGFVGGLGTDHRAVPLECGRLASSPAAVPVATGEKTKKGEQS